jgi:hypothetical protein
LVRFRVKEASRRELKEELKQAIEHSNDGSNPNGSHANEDGSGASAVDLSKLPESIDASQLQGLNISHLRSVDIDPPIFSSDPQLEAVGPFRRGTPPTHLLESCHTLCMLLAVAGFVMAMVGVLCYVWAMLPASSCVLASACVGVCVVAAVLAIFLPQNVSLFSPSYVIDTPSPGP